MTGKHADYLSVVMRWPRGIGRRSSRLRAARAERRFTTPLNEGVSPSFSQLVGNEADRRQLEADRRQLEAECWKLEGELAEARRRLEADRQQFLVECQGGEVRRPEVNPDRPTEVGTPPSLPTVD